MKKPKYKSVKTTVTHGSEIELALLPNGHISRPLLYTTDNYEKAIRIEEEYITMKDLARIERTLIKNKELFAKVAEIETAHTANYVDVELKRKKVNETKNQLTIDNNALDSALRKMGESQVAVNGARYPIIAMDYDSTGGHAIQFTSTDIKVGCKPYAHDYALKMIRVIRRKLKGGSKK